MNYFKRLIGEMTVPNDMDELLPVIFLSMDDAGNSVELVLDVENGIGINSETYYRPDVYGGEDHDGFKFASEQE